jgi:hypothetical protein
MPDFLPSQLEEALSGPINTPVMAQMDKVTCLFGQKTLDTSKDQGF